MNKFVFRLHTLINVNGGSVVKYNALVWTVDNCQIIWIVTIWNQNGFAAENVYEDEGQYTETASLRRRRLSWSSWLDDNNAW